MRVLKIAEASINSSPAISVSLEDSRSLRQILQGGRNFLLSKGGKRT
jgi:hypothetical protein